MFEIWLKNLDSLLQLPLERKAVLRQGAVSGVSRAAERSSVVLGWLVTSSKLVLYLRKTQCFGWIKIVYFIAVVR